MRNRHWVLIVLALLTVLLTACGDSGGTGSTTPVLGAKRFTCQVNEVNDSNPLTGCNDQAKNNLIYKTYQEIDYSNGSLAVTLQKLDAQSIVTTTDGPYQYNYLVILYAVQGTQDAYVITVDNGSGNGGPTEFYYIEGSDTVQFTAIPTKLSGTPAKTFNYGIAVSGQKLMITQKS